MQSHWKYIILGAGCAGLSLCMSLLERGVTDGILLLDRKTAFTDDRTWCFWDARPTPFDALAAHRWSRWRVIGGDGRTAEQTSERLHYVHIRGRDFYERILETFVRHPNVCLRLGQRILGYDEDKAMVRVRTDNGEDTAEFLFDSTALPHPEAGPEPFTYQHFFGQTVQMDRPCFEPECCTLMDFRCDQRRGIHFFYVLPFSPTQALIENTYIAPLPLPVEVHRREIREYLAQQFGKARMEIGREEAGCIPMTTQALPVRRAVRTFFIGTAGGCSKPSTGYTFLRIQDQCRRLADALTRPGATPSNQTPSAKHLFFDAVFLAVLMREPERFPRVFYDLFKRVPPEILVRFLSEESSWSDDLHVVLSLCPSAATPFLAAAARYAVRPRSASPT